jgi:serine/threonine protein phosphatase PrpC
MGAFAFSGPTTAVSGWVRRHAEHPVQLIDWAGLSDPGCQRAHNEDSWRMVPEAGLMVLADGMGGYNAGEVASAVAVDSVAGFPFEDPSVEGSADPLEQLAAAFAGANSSIIAAAAGRPECLGMGSTLAVAWVAGSRLFHAHVGDSRVYLLRSGRLARLTRDHSVGQAMRDAGVAEQSSSVRASLRGVLTKALGVESSVEPDFGEVALEPGDRVLLCSDGISDLVPDAAIARQLARDEPVHAVAGGLVEAALKAGGADNATVVLAAFASARRERS